MRSENNETADMKLPTAMIRLGGRGWGLTLLSTGLVP